MSLHVEIQNTLPESDYIPATDSIRQWADAAWDRRNDRAEMVVRITDESEITNLNQQYRGKEGATNVLSFPMGEEDEEGITYLGDVVICAPVVKNEASAQAKSVESHWAHMVIHGTLHLLGYDHQALEEAEVMESLEIKMMQHLGFDNPYLCEKK